MSAVLPLLRLPEALNCPPPDAFRQPTRSDPADAELELRNLALDRIEQGLCVFDGQQRLLLFNRRYAEIYDLEPSQLSPGMTLRDVVDLRYAAGTGPRMSPAEYAAWRDRISESNERTDTEVELQSGKVLAILHKPLADGGWVSTHTDITERRRAESRVRYMAHHDALTGLPNRALFLERLETSVARLRGEDRLEDYRSSTVSGDHLVAVLLLDLDHFKDVNDTLGHSAGDELLRQVAIRIRRCLGEDQTVSRLGGDEFAVLLDGTFADSAQINEVAHRVIQDVSQPYVLDGQEASVAVSIGIALCGGGDCDAEPAMLLRQADVALYRAKGQQRGSCCFFQAGMDAALNRRREMERDLRSALAEGGLDLHFQPFVTLGSRRVVGVEALARWHHPRYGVVPPAEFIPLAEASGLIVELGTWVIDTACACAAKWDGVTLAVNLSPEQVCQPNLVELVETALLKTGLRPDRLELEITEGIVMRDTAATLAKLARLRALGIGIALDDFGTGYSSLSYLRRFPFSKLKIDRSFVSAMTTDVGTGAIVRAIVALGQSLNMTVTAEGIETEAQWKMLCAIGCNQGQGYLFGQACPPDAFDGGFFGPS